MPEAEASKEVIVHHVLHDQWYGRTNAVRVDKKCIMFHLPDLQGHDLLHVLLMDARDQRTLFVFDGDVLNGGLPKAGAIAHFSHIGQLRTHFRNIRKLKVGEDLSLLRLDGTDAVVDLRRNFLLLPHGQSVVRSYRPRSLAPRYLFVQVDKKSTPERVNILTSSG
ncbi:MAG: hypothetical protein U1A25_03390 [Candidatus Sungbacteria bacterium]|nr:hypothetical protein [bacterium]MDZ4260688.1 hypothetical protein [Candidatus Sungbacteria bacterium]